MKLIAFYLPQFHEIPENNQWWGEGYTDWESVKKASKIKRKHVQPKIPLHNNYYNLLDKTVMEWQSELSIKAGLSGFCFYHYWFKGKKLLERPVENYLKWTDCKQKFCLSWANESWIRTWSNVTVEGNAWNDNPNRREKAEKPVAYLMKQDYGNREDWKEHFSYLLPFFQDSRYIKVNKKPVFILYKPLQIKCLNSMIKYWNELAKESGFPGLYIIATNVKEKMGKSIQAKLMYEPSYTLGYEKPFFYKKRDAYIDKRCKRSKKNIFCKTYLYDIFYYRILKRKIRNDVPVYRGVFTDFDDTPRRGNKGIYFKGVSVRKFYHYLEQIKAKTGKEEFVFVTAWNEWGEGAYLEPDTKRGYEYLQAIRQVMKLSIGGKEE